MGWGLQALVQVSGEASPAAWPCSSGRHLRSQGYILVLRCACGDGEEERGRLGCPSPWRWWGEPGQVLTGAVCCSPEMWSTASCTEGKKHCLVMVELKKLPRSSWARTDAVQEEKHPKLWQPAELSSPHLNMPPSPCAVRDTGGLQSSGCILRTTCSLAQWHPLVWLCSCWLLGEAWG